MDEQVVGRRGRMGADRRPKGPGITYSALTTLMVVLLGVVALTATQPPPPTIAEFAPQAVEQIEEAPQEQTSDFGLGDGGAGGPGATPTPPPSLLDDADPPPIDVPRVRRCIGDPPRQTEDPQSPPCVPYWEGDNGGATAKGVTGSAIRVGMFMEGVSPRALTALAAHFNSRYELYGRRLQFIEVGGGGTCEQRRASAAEADAEQIFAVGDVHSGNAPACFQAEAARRGIISVAESAQFPESALAKTQPYFWQYAMGQDKLFTATGEMICGRLVGSDAEYSPDPLINSSPRKFGLVLQSTIRDIPVDTTPIDRALERCGAEISDREHLSSPDDAGIANHQGAQTTMLRFKSNDITSVIMLGHVFLSQNISTAADTQSYFPEWIFSTYGEFDTNSAVQAFWPQASQRRSIIGINARPPNRPWSMEPAYWAAREVDPDFPDDAMQGFTRQYHALLVLASGIQMAGPDLTAERLETALRRTQFPYPTNDPTRSGDVGFRSGHSMTDDASEFWWSNTARSPTGYLSTGTPGAFCYVDNGARHRPGSWPTGPAPFFQGPCDIGPS